MTVHVSSQTEFLKLRLVGIAPVAKGAALVVGFLVGQLLVGQFLIG